MNDTVTTESHCSDGKSCSLGGPLPLIFDAHGKRALEAFGCFDDVLGDLAPNDPVLRRVPHWPPVTLAVATTSK
jgi:hypothetical protein